MGRGRRTSRKQAEAEDCQIPQTVDRDRDEQVFLYFVGNRKKNSADDLRHQEPMPKTMDKSKGASAKDDSNPDTPPPQKAIKYSSEENFFCHRRDDSANKEKEKKICRVPGKAGSNQGERIDTGDVQNSEDNPGKGPEAC